MAKTNTTKSLNEISDVDLQKEIKLAGKYMANEKLVDFSVPKSLESSVGKTLLIGVNGVFVNIPVDGKNYPLPETLAKHGKEYINNLV